MGGGGDGKEGGYNVGGDLPSDTHNLSLVLLSNSYVWRQTVLGQLLHKQG